MSIQDGNRNKKKEKKKRESKQNLLVNRLHWSGHAVSIKMDLFMIIWHLTYGAIIIEKLTSAWQKENPPVVIDDNKCHDVVPLWSDVIL